MHQQGRYHRPHLARSRHPATARSRIRKARCLLSASVIIALVSVLLFAGATFTSTRTRRAQPAVLRATMATATVIAVLALILTLAHEMGEITVPALAGSFPTICLTTTLIAFAWFAAWEFSYRTKNSRGRGPQVAGASSTHEPLRTDRRAHGVGEQRLRPTTRRGTGEHDRSRPRRHAWPVPHYSQCAHPTEG